MIQGISQEQIILEKIRNLTPEQRKKPLDFIDSLHDHYPSQPETAEIAQTEEKSISFYEATQEWAGCIDWGPGDLATNKEYLEGLGKSATT